MAAVEVGPHPPEDSGSQPIVLQMAAPFTGPEPTLQQLLDDKTKVDDMCSALTSIPSVLYLQIERRYVDERTQQIRVNLQQLEIPEYVEVPCFKDRSLDTFLVRFEPVAVTAHLGDDGAGHYRSGLKCWDEFHGWHWISLDDDSVGRPQPSIPCWLESSSTMILLCPAEQYTVLLPRVMPSQIEDTLAILQQG